MKWRVQGKNANEKLTEGGLPRENNKRRSYEKRIFCRGEHQRADGDVGEPSMCSDYAGEDAI